YGAASAGGDRRAGGALAGDSANLVGHLSKPGTGGFAGARQAGSQSQPSARLSNPRGVAPATGRRELPHGGAGGAVAAATPRNRAHNLEHLLLAKKMRRDPAGPAPRPLKKGPAGHRRLPR